MYLHDSIKLRKQVDFTGWDLIFTNTGKYYFYDSVERISKWRPPENLLEYLLDISPDKLDILFDPDVEYIIDNEESLVEDYVQEEEEEKEDYSIPEEELEITEINDIAEPLKVEAPKRPKLSAEEHSLAKEEFKLMLYQNEGLDPFQSWENICNYLANDPRFIRIPTDKERRTIFDEACPVLVERARENRNKKLQEAQANWRDLLKDLTLIKAPATWTEFSRIVKKEHWYRLLDPKQLEKEYRLRLKELRDQSIIYQIPK